MNRLFRPFMAILRKEIRHQFLSGSGLAATLFFATIVSLAFFGGLVNPAGGLYRGILGLIPPVASIVVPIATMGIWSFERKGGTDRLLASFPTGAHSIILAKFLALLAVWAIMIALCAPLFAMRGVAPERGVLVSSLIGLLLFGAFAVSLGQCVSGFLSNPVSAYLASAFPLFVMNGSHLLLPYVRVPEALLDALSSISFAHRLDATARGILDSRDVLFFVAPTAFFLMLDAFRFSSGRSRA